MVETGIREGLCNTIHQYIKAYNIFMEDYDKDRESSYVKYWDVYN